MGFFDLTRAGNIYLPDADGHFVSDNQRRVAAVLRDYDPYLEIQWIPPADREPVQDKPFRVVHRIPGRDPYVVCFADECDERLLARVFQSDNSKGNVQNYVDAHNAAVEAMRLKEKMERNQEAHELAYSVARSNKIHYKHNGLDFGKAFGGRLG